MLSEFNVDPDERRSFLESVAFLLDDADISSPQFHAVISLFVIDENTPDEVYGESFSKVDRLVEAMIGKSSFTSELSMEKNLDLFVKDNFIDAFFAKNVQAERTHAEDTGWDKRHPGFVLTNLSADEERCYCRHVREMSVLLAILQRPPAMFMSGGFPLLYRKLMQRLKADNLIDVLVARIERVQKGLQSALRPGAGTLLKQLLVLYVDTLFYFSFHLNETEKESLITGESLNRMTYIANNLCATGRSAPSTLQRSSLVLICVVVKHISRIPLATLQYLLEGSLFERSSQTNLLNFILLAAVPSYSLKNADPSVERWLRQALELLRQCTTYDFEVDNVFSREGLYARQHTFLIKRILGATFEKFWTHISSFWWTCCSMPALISIARSYFIYAFTWSRIPPGALAFLEFIRFHLRACACLPSACSDATQGRGKAQLLTCEEGTDGEMDRSGFLHVSQPSSCFPDKEQVGLMAPEFGDQPAAATPLNFDTAEARCVFFLALYSYTSAALLFHCDCLKDADEIFFLSLTHRPPAPGEDADTASPLPSVSTSNRTTSKLPLPAPPLWKGDELNLLSQCMEYLIREFTSMPLTASPPQHMHGSFYDAAVSLLYAILLLFPREKGLANSIANRDLFDLFVQLLLHHLKYDALFIERQDVNVLRMLLSLLQVHFDALSSLSCMAAKLLTESIATPFSKGFAIAVNLAMLHLTAYANLCQRAEERMISPNRLLFFLTDLRRGVLSGSLEAVQFFACLMVRLKETVETVGFRTQIMLEETTQEKAKFMIEQLFEGTAGLIRVYQTGSLSLCGYSTFNIIELSLTVILEIMRVCGEFSLVSTSLLPSMEGCNDGNEVPVSYVLLSLLAAPTFPPCLPAAQLLGVALQRGHALLPALSSNLLGHTVRALSASLHNALRTKIGTPGNAIRLEVLSVMGRCDLATLQFLKGPDSLPANREAVEPADLAISKVLSEIVLHEGASSTEKSSALELLVALGLTESLPLNRVASFLSESVPEANKANRGFEQVAMAAAVVHFINAVICIQMCKHPRAQQATRGSGSSRLGPTPPADSPGNSSFAKINDKCDTTPLLKSSQTVPTDTIDLVLRHGSELLGRVVRCYEELGRRVHHVAGAPMQEWQMTLSAPSLSTMLPSTTLSLATANGLRTVDPQLTISQLQLRRKQLWNHHPTLSWVEASRLGAAAPTTGYPSSRQNPFHTEALPNPIEVEESVCRVVCPLVLGEAYCFIGSSDDATLNLMASTLEAVRRMAVALEGTLWLSANEPESGGRIFLARYFEMLRDTIEWVTQCKPTAPLLTRPLWDCTRQCLKLMNTVSRVLESFSLGSGQRLEVDAPTRRALYRLLEFMRENTKDLALLNSCLNVIATLGREDNTGVDFGDRIFFILADVLFEEERQNDVVIGPGHLAFLEGCIKIFECLAPNSCPLLVLAPLLPCLFRRATEVSFSIVANSPGDIHTLYFSLALRCMRDALLKTRTLGTLSLLPLENVMSMMDSLNVYSTTFTLDSTLTYRRQSWHIVWCNLLELLSTAISTLSGNFESNEDATSSHSVAQRAQLELIGMRLPHFPRFLVALGGFSEAVRPNHAPAPLFYWDVEELELCVRLVAQLSILVRPMSSLAPLIQQCFLRIHRYQLHSFHTTSSNDPVTLQSEKNTIRNVLVRAVQNQLTFFILQPFHGAPFLISERGEGRAVLAGLSSQSDRSPGRPATTREAMVSGTTGEKPALTFDVLWRFISHEFHIIRRSRSALKGRPLETTPSVESSLTRSPSHVHDGESCVEDDLAGPDVLVGMPAEQQGLHLENIQMALVLYTLAAEELGRGDGCVEFAAGAPQKRELRVCTEKLLHVLGNIMHEMKRMGSPHRLNMLDSICERLNATIPGL